MPPSSPHEPLRLSADDLYSPRVEAFLDEQAMMNRAMPEVQPQPWIFRVLYSSYFYLSLASGLGAFVAWMIMEPFFVERTAIQGGQEGFHWANFLFFPTVAGSIGLFLGAAEGIMCRNVERALICASVSLGVGFAGGIVAIFLAGIIFLIAGLMVAAVSKGQIGPGETAEGAGPLGPDDGPRLGLGGRFHPRRHRPGDRAARVQGRRQRAARRRAGRPGRRVPVRPDQLGLRRGWREGLAGPGHRIHDHWPVRRACSWASSSSGPSRPGS